MYALIKSIMEGAWWGMKVIAILFWIFMSGCFLKWYVIDGEPFNTSGRLMHKPAPCVCPQVDSTQVTQDSTVATKDPLGDNGISH